MAIVKQQAQAREGVNLEVIAALLADPLVLFEALAPNHLTAAVALQPKPFGFDLSLAVIGFGSKTRLFAGKPGHAKIALKPS